MIRSLSKEVQAQLRSGISICSLQQCVEELVLNSIDARATCVAVKIDIEACKVQVLDNGSGMDQESMEKVGIRYCTSKCSSLEDLENLRFHGFRGEAIASLANLATLVEISSRSKTSVKTFVKTFKEGKASDVSEAPTTRPSAGTTVLICNFFHNMPVRRKRMDSALEVERVRQRVEAISLMHPSVSFTVRRDCSGTLLVQLPKARNIYYRFVQIHGLSRAQKLREVNHAFRPFQITGYIGREGHYNSSLQFLFVNSRLVLKTRIHKLLNGLLRRPSSSSGQINSPSSPKQRGGADLHGVYLINIECHYSEYDVCLEPAKTLIEFRDWDSLVFSIEEVVKEFLTKENLISECSESDLGCVSSTQESRDERNLASGTCDRNVDDTESSRVAEKTESVDVQEVQQTGQILDLALSTASSDSDPEVLSVDVVDAPLQTTRVSENVETDAKVLESAPDVIDDNNPHLVNSNKPSKIMIDHKETHDSLRRFLEPDLSCAPKRKPSLHHAQSHTSDGSHEPKIAKVTPRRKLTLPFEMGCFDKFKRPFEKGVGPKARNAPITDDLCPSEVAASTQVEDLGVESSHGLFSCTKPEGSSTCKRKRFSLAAKLSHKADGVKPYQCRTEEALDKTTQDAVSDRRESESERFSGHDERPEGAPSDKLTLTSPHGQDASLPSTLTCFSTTAGETEPTKYMTHSPPLTPLAQIFNPASHHDPATTETGHEEPAVKENRGSGSDETKPSDWLAHYDDSLGKLVYINQVTGLSKYDVPSLEEPQVPCVKNITNMAVSVVSKTGFEYRCYPFQTDLVLPFLPKPRAERMLRSSVVSADQHESPNALQALFAEWNNPVFVRPAQVAMDVSSGQAEGLAVKIHNILFPYRFTKDMIYSMEVVNQVDKKFLACLINTTNQKTTGSSDRERNLLVLVDQHAAHERVRLEGLVMESYEDDPDAGGERRLCSSCVSPPIEISVTEEEMRLLRLYQPFLRDLALELSFPQTERSHVLLKRLPTCFIEKENTERRRGRRSVIKSIAQEYLREHIEFLHTTGRVKGSLPLTVHNVLASQACHGAIKFNDDLSKEECCSLVASLSSCQLPFQCAHGRPSILPLADLQHLEDEQERPKPNLGKLRRLYKTWQLYGKN